MSEISLYHWQSSRLESVRNAFSADVCKCFLVLDWIIHQRVPWEQNIRYIYLPSLQLSIIMWLSHLLTSFSSQRNRYLFPKYCVMHIWAERFRYGYTPWVSSTNITDRHDIAEILLKVALKTLTLTLLIIFIWLYEIS